MYAMDALPLLSLRCRGYLTVYVENAQKQRLRCLTLEIGL